MGGGSLRTLKDKLAHAFAVGPAPDGGPGELPPVLERAARGIVARGLEAPAMVALESLTPLGFLGGQLLVAAGPLIGAFFPGDDWREAAAALEDRRALARFAGRIEQLARGESGR